jgi:hypothetical protein
MAQKANLVASTPVQRLLLAARVAQGLTSNYALSKVLDVRENDVSRWWNGHNLPSTAMVVRLAQLAELDAAHVLPTIEALRTSDADTRAAWHRLAELAERAAAVAACAILALCITEGPPDAGALVAGAVSTADDAGLTVDTLQRIAAGAGALTVYTLWRVLCGLFDPSQRGVNRPRRASISLA